MKKSTIILMVIEFIAANVWLNWWVETHQGIAMFVIAWAPAILWIWYWVNHPIFDQIMKKCFGDDDTDEFID